jgi:uncharacterized membrane protein
MAEQFEVIAGDEKQTSRLEGFSDGVFGFALTLLVLDLKVPDLSGGPAGAGMGKFLISQLLGQWPGYAAFVTSFFSVLVMWMNHHRIFRMVYGVDARLMLANGFLLLMVTVVPFPTAIISEYFDTPAGKAACAVYGATFVLISTGFFMTLTAAMRPGILSRRITPATMSRVCRTYKLGPPMYLLATLVAPISKWVSMGICTGLWILWLATAAEVLPGTKTTEVV